MINKTGQMNILQQIDNMNSNDSKRLEDAIFPTKLPSFYEKQDGGESEMHQANEAYSKNKPKLTIRCVVNVFKDKKNKLLSNHKKLKSVEDKSEKETKNRDDALEIFRGDYNTQGLPHGPNGFMKWKNGDVYEGTFWNGIRDGFGTFQCSDGSKYVGDWECDKMHGNGTYHFPDGSVYKGSYFRGLRDDNNGQFYFPNGDMYVGSFRNGNFEGIGSFYYQNGDSFEGSFVDGKRHGTGTYYNSNGETTISSYRNDKPVGMGILWNKNKTQVWRLTCNVKTNQISIEKGLNLTEHILSQKH